MPSDPRAQQAREHYRRAADALVLAEWAGQVRQLLPARRARKAWANGPRWVRAVGWSVIFGAYLGVIAWIAVGAWASASTRIGAGVLLGAVLGPVLVWCEPWERRQFARRLRFDGDPAVAQAVRIEVDAGGVPTQDATRRELTRRYAGRRYELRIVSRVMAVFWLLLFLMLVLAWFFGGFSSSDLLMIVLFTSMSALYGYDAWIRMPRYRRALAALGPNDTGWSFSHTADSPTPRA